MTTKCEVRENCKHRYDCDWCIRQSDYEPVDRKIKSPAQIESAERKKFERKEKKKSESSARARKSRRVGKRAESDMKKLWESWGYKTDKVPLSGALKTLSLKSDLMVTIDGKLYYNEVKRRVNLSTLYNLTESDCAVYIEGFCYVMNQNIFHRVLNGVFPETVTVKDSRFKALHGFFEQDNAEFVSMKSAYKHWIIAVSEKTWTELKGRA